MDRETNKILSIIVPTYNAEKFLDKGLSSFLVDDNSILNEIEVVVVNDGTPDNSVAVAQKYVDRYPNVYRILNKKNGGHGSAINAGVGIINGRYFKVVDADDWVDTQILKETVCYLKQHEQQKEKEQISIHMIISLSNKMEDLTMQNISMSIYMISGGVSVFME